MKEFDKSNGKTLRSSEWAKEDGLWRFRDQIYVPLIADLQHQINEQHHDSRIGGHAGRWKMLELLMHKLLVAEYVALCWTVLQGLQYVPTN
jgi:hypothetical protein